LIDLRFLAPFDNASAIERDPGRDVGTLRRPADASGMQMKQLPDFVLETYFSRWEFAARYNLCGSDMESMSISELLELADESDRAAWDELRLGYIETYGTPALRNAIAASYEDIGSDQVLAFAGAEEGLYVAMQTLLSEGDHAVIIAPNYQSAESVPAAVCATTAVALDYNGRWSLDIDKLLDAVTDSTRVMSINFPHNPTGLVISPDDLNAIIEFADRRGIYLFSDEVYRHLERPSIEPLPQVADVYERGLSLNVMSKSYGLPGLRIGWIATRDTALLSRMERHKHYLSICNSSPSEHLACIALKAAERILTRNREIIVGNLKRLEEFFAEFAHRFEWSVPEGGCIAYPRYLGNEGIDEFCARLVEQSGVLLLPGSVYQSTSAETPANHFRIGFGRVNMPEALDRLRSYLADSS